MLAGWRVRAGRYGPWDRAYDLFRRWQRDGTWKRIFEQLQAEADVKGLFTWDVSVDSTIARAHQHAAGARKKGHYRRNLPAASTPSPTITEVELVCQAVKPPSTWIEAPVMYAPSALARWATVAAISAASA